LCIAGDYYIFEGNFVNKLPVIGRVRQTITKGVKRGFDKTIGNDDDVDDDDGHEDEDDSDDDDDNYCDG
jgi:hypothetical protein